MSMRCRCVFSVVLMLVLVLRGLLGTAMAAGMAPSLPAGGPAPQAHSAQHQQKQGKEQGQEQKQGQEHLRPSQAADNALALAPGLQTTAEHGMGTPEDGMHSQCPEHATASPCGTSAHAHAPLCSACDICHSSMLPPPQLTTPAQPGAVQARPGTTAPFASAPAALAIKPPIA